MAVAQCEAPPPSEPQTSFIALHGARHEGADHPAVYREWTRCECAIFVCTRIRTLGRARGSGLLGSVPAGELPAVMGTHTCTQSSCVCVCACVCVHTNTRSHAHACLNIQVGELGRARRGRKARRSGAGRVSRARAAGTAAAAGIRLMAGLTTGSPWRSCGQAVVKLWSVPVGHLL
jgi:hypothetical protein